MGIGGEVKGRAGEKCSRGDIGEEGKRCRRYMLRERGVGDTCLGREV